MALLHSLEEGGKILFRYRGQIPVLLFLTAVPVIYFTDYELLDGDFILATKLVAVLISATGFGIRIYTIGTSAPNTSGRNTQEQVADTLNCTGIYSIVRHPLYLGNYLMWAGTLLYTLDACFFIIASLLFWIYYERIMFAEERYLERKFNLSFLNWSQHTPAFLPSFKQYKPSQYSFSLRKVLRKEYSGFLAMVVGFVFVETLQNSFTAGKFNVDQITLFILGFAIILTLVVKFISKRWSY